MPSLEEQQLLTTYLRSVWLVQTTNQYFGGSTVGGFFAQANGALLALVILTAVTASRPLFVILTVMRIVLRIASMPFIWEVELWAVIMDLTLLSARGDVLRASSAIRLQMTCFYAGAAFWKINSSFLDATTSCGTIFFAQLITAYAPTAVTDSDAVVSFLGAAAPAAALSVELAVPALLATWRRGGLAVALLFHLLVVLTPPPNNAGGFSVCAAQYLFFFAPRSVANALDATFDMKQPRRAAGLALVAATATAIGCRVGNHLFFFDTAPLAYALQMVLLSRAAIAPAVKDRHAFRTDEVFSSPVALAIVYAFVLPSLGVLDQMAPNMFSNQRFHGGSNHLVAPTGLAHRAMGAAAFSIVRVHSTTSPLIGAQHPAEVSSSFAPRARSLLQSAGHSGRQWNPMLGRVIGLMAVAGPAPADMAKPRVRYTMPAIELRRLIAEAREANHSFEVEYATLDGLEPPQKGGAEKWRAMSQSRLAVYRWDATTRVQSCTVGRGLFAAACPIDEIAMLQPAPEWALRLGARRLPAAANTDGRGLGRSALLRAVRGGARGPWSAESGDDCTTTRQTRVVPGRGVAVGERSMRPS